jgi:hypothetical protein
MVATLEVGATPEHRGPGLQHVFRRAVAAIFLDTHTHMPLILTAVSALRASGASQGVLYQRLFMIGFSFDSICLLVPLRASPASLSNLPLHTIRSFARCVLEMCVSYINGIL